ncbi:LysR family transcriptional regulator [Sinorhizobium sp. BG8]|uniref:LysR family transcriptional regulator n=1 Tax=Sinorhizobium sp. BG8 TaxID=2613773 RepID=UPI00193D71F8|nr:LysR family transcriptional regulator [Sinorhizobium sp. BG8]QRM57042.1 LysR family transcriptional regulator [Sinorhizobium sp. BG8]
MEQRKRRLPPLKSLLFLETVVRTGSVTAAADELSITHSAVSKQLSQLEAWMGVPLFIEKRKGMIPTADIDRLAAVLGNAFDEIHDALEQLRPSRIERSKLQVIAPATFAMRWLIPKLQEFHTPERPVDTMVRPTHTPDNWLDMPFDVAIRRGGIIPSQFSPRHLFTETLSLVLPARIAGHGKVITKESLKEIGLLEAVTRPGELKTWLKTAGLAGSMAGQALKLPHFYIALDAMFAGRGALVVPTFLIEGHLLRGEVVEPFPELRVEGPSYQVFANPASREREAAAGFVDWIVSCVPERRQSGGQKEARLHSEAQAGPLA